MMNAANLHLAIVHLPLSALLGAVVLLLCARAWGEERAFRLALLAIVAGALAAAMAYYTGPSAHQILIDAGFNTGDTQNVVETHALWGRVSFVVLGLCGALAFQAWLQHYQGERPAAWQRWTLLIAGAAMLGVLAWTSHLGGQVRHTEIRGALQGAMPPAACPQQHA